MDPKQMMKQMIDFNKTAVEKTFTAMTVMQDQTEKMVSMWMDQNKWYPEEGKKAIAEWVKTCKKGREEFKTKLDEGYKNLEQYFTGLEK